MLAAADEFQRLSEGAKTFILKAARAVNSRKPFDAAATFDAALVRTRRLSRYAATLAWRRKSAPATRRCSCATTSGW